MGLSFDPKKNYPSFLFVFSICVMMPLSFGGVALQSGSLYLFGLILPGIILWKNNASLPTSLYKVALFLILIWLIFPLWNILTYFSASYPKESNLFPLDSIKELFRSHTPSTVLITGIIIGATVYLVNKSHKKEPKENFLTQIFKEDYLNKVWLAATIGTLIFLAYQVAQYVWGIDLKASDYQLTLQNKMPNGFFRVSGFYGHTLSLASVAVALLAFFWSFLHQITKLPLNSKTKPLKAMSLMLSLGFLLMIFLSGSRTVLVVGLIVIFWIPFFYSSKKLSLILKSTLAVCFLAALLYFEILTIPSGLYVRFNGLTSVLNDWQKILEIPRIIFWQVHWQMIQSSPFIGFGYWSMGNLTNFYYDILGYQDYFRKYNAHNIFLQSLVELGLLGFTILGALIAKLYKTLKSLSPKENISNILLRSLGWSIGANLLHGLTQNTFFDANLIAVYMTLIVIIVYESLFKGWKY